MFLLKDVRLDKILHIPNLIIEGNRTTCITGESGGGKTTLLKLLNRMSTPDAGTITYLGQPLESYDPVQLRRQVVMMAQDPLVFPGNIRENMLMGLRFSQKPEASDEDVRSMMEMVKLRKSLNEDPTILSGGEKQRLALGRVLLMHPEVLLLDEPSSSLDDETESLVIRRVTGYVQETGKTLVMVTHSRSLAESIDGDHILFEDGSPKLMSGGD